MRQSQRSFVSRLELLATLLQVIKNLWAQGLCSCPRCFSPELASRMKTKHQTHRFAHISRLATKEGCVS